MDAISDLMVAIAGVAFIIWIGTWCFVFWYPMITFWCNAQTRHVDYAPADDQRRDVGDLSFCVAKIEL